MFETGIQENQISNKTKIKNNGLLKNLMPDEVLFDVVQKQTFKYFWDFAHPCGCTRERNHPDYKNIITSGGTGFGLMVLIVGAKRKWITREAFIKRIKKIIHFFSTCQTYHGAFSHWYNGESGETLPFSKKDDGADLVETSFLIAGLLTVRQYLYDFFPEEKTLTEEINRIWHNIDWQWFTRKKEVLYWHGNNNSKQSMRLKIEGYNEALITYILAASSPTFGIDKKIYHSGWARNGLMKNGNSFYNQLLPLGPGYGGPMFFAQYSFLGLDPRGLKDQYADYWQQNVAHAKINYAHCVNNPGGYKGYNEECWGLSACDSGKKYKPHHPQKDNGTICPSAAIASLPYVPEESLKALKYFYFDLNKKMWGEYGFFDAFNKSRSWYAKSYLAINQGPIIIMIENYRTGLLWNLFMRCKEVQYGLKKLGFEVV